MTYSEKRCLSDLELMLAMLVHKGELEIARRWGPVIEWIQKGEPTIALLEAETMGIEEASLDFLRGKLSQSKWA